MSDECLQTRETTFTEYFIKINFKQLIMPIVNKVYALWAVFEIFTKNVKGYYMRFMSRGVIDFQSLVTQALKGSTYSPREVLGSWDLIKDQALEYMRMGYRVDIGDEFIAIWPNIVGSVKDTVDPSTGKTIAADPKKLKASVGETKISCSVNKKYQKALSNIIEWKKASKRENGQVVEEEDDTVDPNDNPETIPTVDTSTGTQDTSVNNNLSTNDGEDGLGG